MDELDKKGCGYKMFKGRATNILGDIEHEKGKKPDAVNYWKEGYTIIAIHGRSRSSVKNFNDHLYERIDKLLDTLMGCNVSIIRDFISHWKNTFLDEGRPETLADEYPGVLGLLTMAEGDYLASQKEYEAAMEVWSQALYYWTLHMVVKDKKNILTLEHLSSNQLIIIKDAIKFTDKRIGIADLLELNSYGVSKEEKTRMRQLSEHFIAMLDE